MYFVLIHKNQYGPYTLNELREMASGGTFTKYSWVWIPREGTWEWVQAGSVPELNRIFYEMESGAAKAASEGSPAPSEPAPLRQHRPTMIIALGGGKGGVGKTTLVAGLGLCLAAMDRSVILVDCDLGGPNLHTALGLPRPPRSSSDFFNRQSKSLSELLIPTRLANLRLLGGRGGILGLANLKYAQKQKFIGELKKLETDYALLDLGAGTSYDTLDFFLAADYGVLVSSPDPLSIEKTYGFLKTSIYRSIARSFTADQAVHAHLERMAERAFRPTVFQFLTELEAESPESSRLVRQHLNARPTGLILNMVMQRQEIENSRQAVADWSHRLGVTVDLLGSVVFDSAMRRSIYKQIPFVMDRARSKAARSLLVIASQKLMKANDAEATPLQREASRRLRQSKLVPVT